MGDLQDYVRAKGPSLVRDLEDLADDPTLIQRLSASTKAPPMGLATPPAMALDKMQLPTVQDGGKPALPPAQFGAPAPGLATLQDPGPPPKVNLPPTQPIPISQAPRRPMTPPAPNPTPDFQALGPQMGAMPKPGMPMAVLPASAEPPPRPVMNPAPQMSVAPPRPMGGLMSEAAPMSPVGGQAPPARPMAPSAPSPVPPQQAAVPVTPPMFAISPEDREYLKQRWGLRDTEIDNIVGQKEAAYRQAKVNADAVRRATAENTYRLATDSIAKAGHYVVSLGHGLSVNVPMRQVNEKAMQFALKGNDVPVYALTEPTDLAKIRAMVASGRAGGGSQKVEVITPNGRLLNDKSIPVEYEALVNKGLMEPVAGLKKGQVPTPKQMAVALKLHYLVGNAANPAVEAPTTNQQATHETSKEVANIGATTALTKEAGANDRFQQKLEAEKAKAAADEEAKAKRARDEAERKDTALRAKEHAAQVKAIENSPEANQITVPGQGTYIREVKGGVSRWVNARGRPADSGLAGALEQKRKATISQKLAK